MYGEHDGASFKFNARVAEELEAENMIFSTFLNFETMVRVQTERYEGNIMGVQCTCGGKFGSQIG